MTTEQSRLRKLVQWLPLILLTLGLGVGGGCQSKNDSRPNIIVIITDDHRHDFLGTVNPGFIQTPNLDRLAAEGVRFSNTFVTTSLCSPARASYLTGQYAHQHGVLWNEDMDLTNETPTFAQRLHDSGYETAYIGKWHMARRSSPREGFDHWVSFNGQGNYFLNTLNVDGRWELCRKYITDELTDRAIAFLKRKKEKPFLMVVSHKAVHQPFAAADRDTHRYAGDPIPEFNEPGDQLGAKTPWALASRSNNQQAVIQRYRQTLVSVDDNIGRLLDELEQLGILDDTAIIYAGDNGYLLGEHHGLMDKRAAFEPSIRVPLIMRYPARATAGEVDEDLVLNVDLAPTIMELAGLSIPPDIQGHSWLDDDYSRTGFLYEYFAHRWRRSAGEVPTCLAVRTKRWKLVTFPLNPEFEAELFDLQNDPGELKNLAADAAHEDVMKRLRSELEKQKNTTGFRWPDDRIGSG